MHTNARGREQRQSRSHRHQCCIAKSVLKSFGWQEVGFLSEQGQQEVTLCITSSLSPCTLTTLCSTPNKKKKKVEKLLSTNFPEVLHGYLAFPR